MPAACAEGLQALGVRAAFLSPSWSAWCEREVSPSHRPALVEDLRHNSRGWRGRGLPSPGAGGSGWQEGAHVSAAALHTCPRLGCLPRPRANGDPWVGSEEVAGVTIHQRPGRGSISLGASWQVMKSWKLKGKRKRKTLNFYKAKHPICVCFKRR